MANANTFTELGPMQSGSCTGGHTANRCLGKCILRDICISRLFVPQRKPRIVEIKVTIDTYTVVETMTYAGIN